MMNVPQGVNGEEPTNIWSVRCQPESRETLTAEITLWHLQCHVWLADRNAVNSKETDYPSEGGADSGTLGVSRAASWRVLFAKGTRCARLRTRFHDNFQSDWMETK